jgi:diguanylate cyclase (GGDEF)-like protein
MHTKEAKGIQIRLLNYGIIIISLVLYAVLIYETVNISVRYQFLSETTQDYISCEKNAALLDTASDYLTEQVRLCVVNQDVSYMNAYFEEINETKRRNQALENLQQHHMEDEIYEALQKALECSDALTQREIYAMKLVAVACQHEESELPQEIREMELDAQDLMLTSEEMLDKAQTLVFDEEYQAAKAQIANYISQASEPILEETQQEQIASAQELKTAVTNDRLLLSVLLIVNIATFTGIILLVIRPLQRYVQCIKNGKRLKVAGTYEFQYLALTYNDICEKNAAYEAVLKRKAERDALTGILNRGAFEQITGLLKDGSGPIALLLVDIDEFKTINDTYGHNMGDRVLKRVAQLLDDTFRAMDYIARIGGDEFTVIMNGVTRQQCAMIRKKADEMNAVLTHPEDDLPSVSLSIGVAFSEQNYSQELFEHADHALYRVKGHGRCGCSFYKSEER